MKNILKISNGSTQTTCIDVDKIDAVVIEGDTATFIVNGTQLRVLGLTEDNIKTLLKQWQDGNKKD